MEKGTSDERLLKIIEGGATEPKRKPSIGMGQKKTLTELIPSAKFNLNLKSIKELKFNLAGFNKGLIAVSLIVTFLFLYSILSGPNVSASNAAYFTAADAAAIAKIISSRGNAGALRKNVLSQDLKRNIFLAPGAKVSASTVSGEVVNVSELIKDLKLVGIIWSAQPEVMIEDGKDARTYVLKKGEAFRNEQFRVKEVSRNSATLEVTNGDKKSEYELR